MPGAKSAVLTDPKKRHQRRYKIGYAFVRCQVFENTGTTSRPSWRWFKTWQMQKAEANTEIRRLRGAGWRLSKLVR